ncbi:hypothetical protein H0H92_004321 [Tricholoma furcatifolium]|nr:hypothetical protein H0H92_004321 [Tricholoma furcatifolium]
MTALCTQQKNAIQSIEKHEYLTPNIIRTQNPTTWNLARLNTIISLRGGARNNWSKYSYTYDESDGAGVDIYILDTGVFVDHPSFEGRARRGPTFIRSGHPFDNINGHGTHCAGIAASSHFGVAKAATIISIKVIGTQYNGVVSAATSDIVEAIEYVIAEYKRHSRKSVISMSLGSSTVVPSLDKAIKQVRKGQNFQWAVVDKILAIWQAINAGIHVVVAAGNDNQDAGLTSPARVKEAITVGASNIRDQRASFSNYGLSVDLFAPGEDILSTSNEGAVPHVAGVVANILSKEGQMSPSKMVNRLKGMAVKNMLLLNLHKLI